MAWHTSETKRVHAHDDQATQVSLPLSHRFCWPSPPGKRSFFAGSLCKDGSYESIVSRPPHTPPPCRSETILWHSTRLPEMAPFQLQNQVSPLPSYPAKMEWFRLMSL